MEIKDVKKKVERNGQGKWQEQELGKPRTVAVGLRRKKQWNT